MGGATARQVSIEEQRQILKQKEQRERERQLSEQLIRRMQLEENPPGRDEDDITNDEVSFIHMPLALIVYVCSVNCARTKLGKSFPQLFNICQSLPYE